VRMRSEPALWLHEVVVGNAQRPEVRAAVTIFGEAEVESRLQPVLVVPVLGLL